MVRVLRMCRPGIYLRTSAYPNNRIGVELQQFWFRTGIIGTFEGHWEDIRGSLPKTCDVSSRDVSRLPVWSTRALRKKGHDMSQAIEAHRKAINSSLEEMASNLVKVLGRVLVAGIVGVRNPKTVSRWANGDVESVRDRYSEERVMALHQIVTFLQEYEGDETIRAFMVGMNPTLDDSSPAWQVKEGNYADVMGAAKVLVTGGFS